MVHSESNQKWNRRPGAVLEEALRLALAVVFMLGGIALLLAGGAHGMSWVPRWAIAAIGVWLAAPRLLRAMSTAGVFGRVRLKDGRLYASGRHFIELDSPMTVEARFQRATLQHRFLLSQVSPNFGRVERTATKRILMMTVVIHQGASVVALAADAIARQLEQPLELEGLNLRRVAISPPPAPVAARLWPQDLVDILRVLQTSAGYQTALSPVPGRALPDPRRSIWPLWKMTAGIFAVLLLWMGAVAGTFVYFRHVRLEEIARAKAEASRAASRAEETARSTYLGQRVTAPMRKWRIEGRVDDVVMVKKVRFEPERVEFMGPMLVVTVEAIFDQNNEPMPPDTEIYHRHVDDRIWVGSRVELEPGEARVVTDEDTR